MKIDAYRVVNPPGRKSVRYNFHGRRELDLERDREKRTLMRLRRKNASRYTKNKDKLSIKTPYTERKSQRVGYEEKQT